MKCIYVLSFLVTFHVASAKFRKYKIQGAFIGNIDKIAALFGLRYLGPCKTMCKLEHRNKWLNALPPRQFDVVCPQNFNSNFQGILILGVLICGVGQCNLFWSISRGCFWKNRPICGYFWSWFKLSLVIIFVINGDFSEFPNSTTIQKWVDWHFEVLHTSPVLTKSFIINWAAA